MVIKHTHVGTRLEGIQPRGTKAQLDNGHQKVCPGETPLGEEEGTTQMTSELWFAIGIWKFGSPSLEGGWGEHDLRRYVTRDEMMSRKMSVGCSWKTQRKNGG